MRVVSLLPSATEILRFAGAGDALVGVTHECDYPPGVERLPKLTATSIDHHTMTSAEIDAAIGERLTDTGSIYSLDAKLLGELEPDLILTQGLCDVCAVSLDIVEQAAARLPKMPRLLSMNPTSLNEVLEVTIEVGDAVGRGEEVRRKVAALRDRIAGVEGASRSSRGRVPVASSGSTRRSPPATGSLRWSGSQADRSSSRKKESRPAPRLVEGVETLAHILHPEVFPDAPEPEDAVRLSYALG